MCFMHPKVKAAVALRSYLAVVPHKGESPFESKNATQGSNINSPVVLKVGRSQINEWCEDVTEQAGDLGRFRKATFHLDQVSLTSVPFSILDVLCNPIRLIRFGRCFLTS